VNLQKSRNIFQYELHQMSISYNCETPDTLTYLILADHTLINNPENWVNNPGNLHLALGAILEHILEYRIGESLCLILPAITRWR